MMRDQFFVTEYDQRLRGLMPTIVSWGLDCALTTPLLRPSLRCHGQWETGSAGTSI